MFPLGFLTAWINSLLVGTSMVGTLLSDVKDSMMGEISAALPYAAGIFAAIAGIFIGVKIFKRITGARS